MLGYDKQNRLVVSGISETYLEQLANLWHYWNDLGDRAEAISTVEYALGFQHRWENWKARSKSQNYWML